MRFAAVTFDFWNTMLHEPPGALLAGRIPRIEAALVAAGQPRSSDQITAAHDAAFATARHCWAEDVQYTAAEAACDIAVALGIPVDAALIAEMTEAFSSGGADTTLEAAPGLAEVLGQLCDAGVALGIVCDVGLTPSPVLRRHLETRDLLEYFRGWSFSDEVGHYKPHPSIFRHAAQRVALPPNGRALHVGDNRRTDIRGARDAGWSSARYTGFFDDQAQDEPEGSWVISELDELVDLVLGLS